MADRPPEEEVVVDGTVVDLDDFTFREQRELKRVIRDDILQDSDLEIDLDNLSMADFMPAAVYVFMKRDKPDFTLDEALDLKFRDIVREKAKTNGRPTKPAAKKS